jgi:isopentenyl-diphosphate delta-isomerase
MKEEEVILVNENDQAIGTMPKLKAHIEGKLHRAFSVFIFNRSGELLLQQRALDKYHSAGKWTNTCCSHPRPGEDLTIAAKRRLKEEMGMECELNPAFSFSYRAELENGLIENEYDHVYFGISDLLPQPNPDEVSGFRYTTLTALQESLIHDPSNYTAWLRICFKEVVAHYQKTQSHE